MSFTYDISTDVGQVRHRIGDVTEKTGTQLKLSDEEIQFELDRVDDSVLLAALACAKALKARAAYLTSGGGKGADRGSLLRQFDELINDIQAELPAEASAPAIYQANKDAAEDDETLTEMPFRVGMDDNP